MPPKRATRTTTAPASKKAAAAPKATATAQTKKRKATEDHEEAAPPKRGRPATSTATKAASRTSGRATKAAKATTAKATPKATAPETATKTASKATTKAAPKKAPTAAATKKTSTTSKTPKPATKAAPAKKTGPSAAGSKTSTKATTAKKASTAPSSNTSAKRKAVATKEEDAPEEGNVSKKRKIAAKPAAAKPKKAVTVKHGPAINEIPTEVLELYVFGAGDGGELGLGTTNRAKNVKRPRLNPSLAADSVGIVHIACGGMHVLALTRDNRILSWGVNDQGALGRDTAWDGGMRNADDEEEEDEDDPDAESGLNPKEANPTAIPGDSFPEGTKFVELAAGDSISLALTEDGYVWAWGTFRDNTGVLGFSSTIEVQRTPVLLPQLKNIKHITSGANHVLALDKSGNVFAFGTGQQNQLGRRVVERTRMAGLTPREFGLPKKQIKYIAAGADHSFAIDTKNNVWTWGLNNFGQCGIFENAGDDDAVVPKPQKVATLAQYSMACLKGGRHHSVGVTDKGELLIWGRADNGIAGLDFTKVPDDDYIKDVRDNPRLLRAVTQIPRVNAKFATASSDHSIAIATDGVAYSWGFSETYQTGQGTDNDVKIATPIANSAVTGKKMVWAGAGGQYSMIAATAANQNFNPASSATNQAAKGQVNGESAKHADTIATTSKATDTTAATSAPAATTKAGSKTPAAEKAPSTQKSTKESANESGTHAVADSA